MFFVVSDLWPPTSKKINFGANKKALQKYTKHKLRVIIDQNYNLFIEGILATIALTVSSMSTKLLNIYINSNCSLYAMKDFTSSHHPTQLSFA